MSNKKIKPEGYTPQHRSYLNALRISGITNMFGATPYLMQEFGLNRREASDILAYWMDTFGKDDKE